MTTRILLRIFFNFVAIMFASLSADGAEIVLRAKANIANSIVSLRDIADVKGLDRHRRVELEQIQLFPAPAQGRTKTIHAQHVSELLRLHGVDISRIRFAGSETTRIQTTLESPSTAVRQGRPQPQPVPQMAVTIRQLNRGDVIREADVRLKPLANNARGIATTDRLADVIGLETLRGYAAGQPIDKRQLRKPLLVHRNEVIRVVARAAGVAVRTTARAFEDGAYGDIIVVQSVENREKYSVHVVGLQQAEVYATSVTASDTAAKRISRRPTPTMKKR